MTEHESNKLLMAVRYCAERNTYNSRKLASGIMLEDYDQMDDEFKLCIYHHINRPLTPEWEQLRRKLKDELMDKDILK